MVFAAFEIARCVSLSLRSDTRLVKLGGAAARGEAAADSVSGVSPPDTSPAGGDFTPAAASADGASPAGNGIGGGIEVAETGAGEGMATEGADADGGAAITATLADEGRCAGAAAPSAVATPPGSGPTRGLRPSKSRGDSIRLPEQGEELWPAHPSKCTRSFRFPG